MGLRNILQPTSPQQTSAGQVLGGGILSLFEPGTTTFIQAFRDSDLATPHTQPIRLSGSGRSDVWINQDCDLQLTDRNGNLILFQENANPDALGASASGSLLQNGSFEEDTNADGTPDSWVLVDDAGSTNARDISESTDGAASFRFTSSGTGGGSLTSENFFPVNELDDLRVIFDIRSTVAGVRNIVRVEWYDVSQISISDSDPYDSTANPVTFTSFTFDVTPPALARFAKIKLIGIDPSVLLAGSTYFDDVRALYPAIVSGVFDNIEIRNNEIISTNTNGEIDLKPDGTGPVNIISSNAVDLVDVNNPTNIGQVVPPATNPHIAMDANQIQAKFDATTSTDLSINPLGGDVNLGSPGTTTTLQGGLEVDQDAFFSTIMELNNNDPRFIIDDGDSAANNRRWDLTGIADQLILRLVDDADTGFANIMTVDRTLNVVDLVAFGGNVEASRLYLPEGAAGGDVTDQGQLYVNATNQLIYRAEGGAEVNLSLAGSGSPGGADTNIQYNDGTGFAGIGTFTFDDTAAAGRMQVNEIIWAADDFYFQAGARLGSNEGLPQGKISSSGGGLGYEFWMGWGLRQDGTLSRGTDGPGIIGFGGPITDGFVEIKAARNTGATDGAPPWNTDGSEYRVSPASHIWQFDAVTAMSVSAAGLSMAFQIPLLTNRARSTLSATEGFTTTFTVTTGTKNLNIQERSYFHHTLTWGGGATVTFAFTNPSIGERWQEFFVQTIDAANGSIVWPVNVVWEGGVVPTPTAGKDVYRFVYVGGLDFVGSMFASNVS